MNDQTTTLIREHIDLCADCQRSRSLCPQIAQAIRISLDVTALLRRLA